MEVIKSNHTRPSQTHLQFEILESPDNLFHIDSQFDSYEAPTETLKTTLARRHH
jgi:hypothetical protein